MSPLRSKESRLHHITGKLRTPHHSASLRWSRRLVRRRCRFFAGACGDGAFLDVAGLQGAEVVGGFEVDSPGFVIDVKLKLLRALTFCHGGGEEEVFVAGLDIKSHGRSLGGLTVEVNLVE